MSANALEKARAAMKARREAGETIVQLNPRQKLAQDPASLRKMINAMCFMCMGDGHEPGWREEIANCTSPHCPLYQGRPYQAKK